MCQLLILNKISTIGDLDTSNYRLPLFYPQKSERKDTVTSLILKKNILGRILTVQFRLDFYPSTNHCGQEGGVIKK